MSEFTPKELMQISNMTQDWTSMMEVFQRSMKGLSLIAFKADMLAIQMKCERLLNESMSSEAQQTQR